MIGPRRCRSERRATTILACIAATFPACAFWEVGALFRRALDGLQKEKTVNGKAKGRGKRHELVRRNRLDPRRRRGRYLRDHRLRQLTERRASIDGRASLISPFPTPGALPRRGWFCASCPTRGASPPTARLSCALRQSVYVPAQISQPVAALLIASPTIEKRDQQRALIQCVEQSAARRLCAAPTPIGVLQLRVEQRHAFDRHKLIHALPPSPPEMSFACAERAEPCRAKIAALS